MGTEFRAIYDVCKISNRIFVLHPDFRRANFYSQQLRVLALVEGLKENGHLEVGNRSYTVVGRGVAGLTASAALATLGATVTSVDKAGYLETYRNVVHRELHPNIIFWPFQGLRPITNLPFLNWSCNTASVVRSQILRQWNEGFSEAVDKVDMDVKELLESPTSVTLRDEAGAELNCDVVIVTAGFQQERPIEARNIKRYWNSFEFDADTEVTIAGSGDGGLIDAAAQFFGAQTIAASRSLAYLLEGTPLKDDVKVMEAEATRRADAGNSDGAHELLSDFYGKVAFASLVSTSMRPMVQTGRKVKLYHKDLSAFGPYAAPINKLMLAFCRRAFSKDISIAGGSLDAKNPAKPTITDTSGTRDIDKDTLLMRIGADPGALKMLDAPQKQTLARNGTDHISTLTAIVADEYNEEVYVGSPQRRIAPGPTDGRFFDELEKLLEGLLAYVDGGLIGAQVARRRREGAPTDGPFRGSTPFDIIVTPLGRIEDFARGLFPIAVQNVSISLMESARVSFASSIGVVP